MAQLIPIALGALGSSIGAQFGLSALGFAVGSAIGQQLIAPDPGSVEGPRIDDLQQFDSSYGKPIPKIWGKVQIQGNVIWAQPLREQKFSRREGGGLFSSGTKVTTYSYYASFAVLLCDGEIDGIQRIWFDSDLVYDVSDTASVESIAASKDIEEKLAIYTGSTTQTADPTMESFEGAGNVPGYRGRAYIVFDDINVDKYRRIPTVTCEVIRDTVSSPTQPSVISSNRVIEDTTIIGAQYDNGVITTVEKNSNGNPVPFDYFVYDIDGNQLDSYTLEMDPPAGGTYSAAEIQNNSRIVILRRGSSSIQYKTAWYRDGFYVGGPIYPPIGSGGTYYSALAYGGTFAAVYENEAVYLIGSNPTDNLQWIAKYSAEDYFPGNYATAYYNVTGYGLSTTPALAAAEDGNIWLYINDDLIEFDEDLSVLQTISGASTYMAEGSEFAVADGLLLATKPGTTYESVLYDISGGSFTEIDSLTGISGTHIKRLIGKVCAVGDSIVYMGEIQPDTTVSLSSILSEICTDAGISSTDFTNLNSHNVRGFSVSRPMSARKAITPLQQAYWFDVAEYGGNLNFVSRGGAVADTIPEDDLNAAFDGAQSEFRATRQQDADIPRRVTVKHLDPSLDGQSNTQYSARITTQANAEQLIDLPLLLTADEAAQISEVLLYDYWSGRETISFSVAAEDYYTRNPTDIVQVTANGRTYNVRLTRIDFDIPGVMKCESAIDQSTLYSPVASGHAPTTQSDAIALSGPTEGRVMDIPLLDDVDGEAGFYIAATGYLSGWSGCYFMMSTDGGVSYETAAIITDRAVIGRADTALPVGDDTVVDTDNTLTVTLFRSDDSLSGITDAQLLNLSNLALVGDEILAFKNASNTSGNTWDVDTLLRAQRGTEWAMDDHVTNEDFVLLSNAQRVTLSSDNIGNTIYYKFVTFGQYAENVVPESFVYTGASLKPYSVAHLEAADAGGGSWDITWIRRTRIGGAWRDYVDAPLSEDSESYTVEVWTGSTMNSTTDVTSESATVSASSGDTIKVYQNSATVGKGYPAEVTIP